MRNSFFHNHPGIVIGALVGLFIGLIFLVFDFWKMLIFVVIIAIGVFIGFLLDGDGRIREQLSRLNRRDNDS